MRIGPKTFLALADVLREAPGSSPLSLPHGGPVLSGEQLLGNVEQLAGGLQQALRAVAPQAPVALSMPNGLEFLASFLGLTWVGRAVMPLNPALTLDAARVQLGDGKAGALIVPGGEDGPARQAALALGLPCWEVERNRRGVGLAGFGEASFDPPDVTPDTVALLLQTSGTTGKPKWVPLTHRNILVSVEHIMATYRLSAEDVCLLVMPMFHVHGLVGAALATLFSGGRLIAPPKFSASHFWGWVSDHRPTWYTAVPTIHQILLSRPDIAHAPKGQFRFVRSCSSPLMPRTMSELEARLGAPVLQAYGMTEAAHQIASSPLPPARRLPGTVGLPTGVEVNVFDSDGRPMPVGEAGEVVIRGENVMDGYLDNPTANAASFVHGWFRTGDIGRVDAGGYLTLVARAKEMINRGGEKVAPAQVDAVLCEVPGVSQAVTFGVPDPIYGEVVHAIVVARPDTTEAALLDHCREKLPAFMVPVRLHRADAVPTGPTGKVSRTELPKILGLT